MFRSFLLSVTLAVCLAPDLPAQVIINRTAGTWEKQLSSDDAKLRRGAAFALGKLGIQGKGYLPAMKARYAAEKDVKVREALVFALGEICRQVRNDPGFKDTFQDPDLEGILIAATQERDAVYLRRSAAFALGCLASKSEATRAALDKALQDEEAVVRQNAAYSLGQFGEAALPSLRKALTDKDSLVKRDAAAALLQVGDADKVREVLKELLPMCGDANSEVRRAALNVLVIIVDGRDKAAVPDLKKALQDTDIDNRRNAALAMSNIGGNETADAVPVLVEAIKNGDAKLRRVAVLAINNIGPAAAKAIPDLVSILRDDPDQNTREYAAIALGGIGKAAPAAVPALVEKLKDVNEARNVRIKCAMVLQHIGPADAAVKAVPSLLAVLGDANQDIGVRDRVMFALRVHHPNLRKLEGTKEAFLQVMNEPLNDKNFMLRYDCAYMLAMDWQSDAPTQVLDRLGEFLKDETIKIFVGTKTDINGGIGEGAKSGSGNVKEVAKGDGRIMAVDALTAMGARRVARRDDIMKQLRHLASDANDDRPLRKAAQELVKAAK